MTAGSTLAVFSGSSSSGGGGVRAVLTAQKRQPRVHVSPATNQGGAHKIPAIGPEKETPNHELLRKNFTHILYCTVHTYVELPGPPYELHPV